MSADLEGITVVAVEQAVAAPYASGRLAAAGARVLKIERPEGDFARYYDRSVRGQSAYFVWLNRGKESVCIDLKSEADRRLLRAMIARADVFVQNLRPGNLAALGFDSRKLRASHPRLTTCDITGFGESGPRANLKAYDLIVQAEAGLCSITGDASGPARVGVSVCDIAAGMTAHAAILQALLVRERTGRGRGIHVSLFDSIADWMNVPFLQLMYGGYEIKRCGVNHATIAPYGAYACADGTTLVFSVQNQREWSAFCAGLLGKPALASDLRFSDNTARVKNRDALDEIVSASLAQLSHEQAAAQLEAIGVAYGRLNGLREAIAHPQLRFMEIQTPEGDIRMVAPAARIDGCVDTPSAVPKLGEHTQRVRQEYQMSSTGSSA
jgi:crotonobetainyl-CoA:carnitine CoA-transferase CaiB-like acyl-CoA transferase